MKIIKFTALWCADCIVMRKAWIEVSEAFPDLTIEEYDFDEHEEVLQKFNVKKVPYTIFIDDQGNELLRLEGMQNKKDLMEKIEQNLK
ncbi:MAG: Thioredoxin [Parcubacteria group bacterium GW2011_GWE2_38_18]|nr:MAG: Thioredoxin [Parcubacteria group bacterium GW2011_GWE2_38_18]